MATYTQILYHIVYGTKNHNATLDLECHDELCRYTAGVLQNKKCFIHKVGGYTEHPHILTEARTTGFGRFAPYTRGYPYSKPYGLFVTS